MPKQVSRAENALSSPQNFAGVLRETLEWMKGREPEPETRWSHPAPRTGHVLELDPEGAVNRALSRVTECGTFPRGKVILHYPDGGRQELGAHQCRSRFCPRCARRRGNRLSEEMGAAVAEIEKWKFSQHQVRLATLTIPNVVNVSEGIGTISAAWHRMLANRRFARLVAGGFRCFEVKPGKDGKWNVHLHAILYLWAPGIPYDVLRQCWDTAAGNTGPSFNQRFDELRKAAKARKGETRASAAARYLVKYLAKFEELEHAKEVPGGLPHLLAALEGRRMFSSWGIGATARRKVRAERPRWASQIRRHLDGYRQNDQRPIRAELDIPGGKVPVPVPLPSMPSRIRAESLPDQITSGEWKIQDVRTGSPLARHGQLDLLPKTRKSLKDWLGYDEAKKKARERILGGNDRWARGTTGSRREWKQWLKDNPAPELPRVFSWRAFWNSAPKSWTTEAAMLLGEQRMTSLGSAVWSRIEPDEGIISNDPSDPRHPEHAMRVAVQHARRTVRQRLGRFSTWEKKLEYLQTMPAHLGGPSLEGILWQEQEHLIW